MGAYWYAERTVPFGQRQPAGAANYDSAIVRDTRGWDDLFDEIALGDEERAGLRRAKAKKLVWCWSMLSFLEPGSHAGA